MNKTHNPNLKRFSQRLRREMTKEERRLWYGFLRSLPVTVKRQQIFGNYIVDFYISSAKLIIELDGSEHFSKTGMNSDKKRDLFLNGLGLCILRYSNADILRNFDGVCEDIFVHL